MINIMININHLMIIMININHIWWSWSTDAPIRSIRLGPGVIELQRFPFLFSICTRIFDVRRQCRVSLERWQPEDSENAFQSALWGLDPELLSFKDFLSFFRLATGFLTLWGNARASSKRWQPGDSEYAFHSALRGLVPELLGFKDFLFLWLFLQNSNSKEVVACFLEGQSIPQRKYRKVKGAFTKDHCLFFFPLLGWVCS